MADHSNHAHHANGMEEHVSTYEGFLKGSVALTLFCLFILVSLVAVRFGHTLNVFSSFAGLVIGAVAILLDLRSGGKWLFSLAALVLFGLITAINVS